MIPLTKNKLNPFFCISALQKYIRRGMEREAMEIAAELLHTSKAFCTMVCNRLEAISHEDIDTAADPRIVPFVRTACEQAREWHELPDPGHSRLFIGNAIRMMCRAQKSREGDHFQAAVALPLLLAGKVPTIPDYAFCKHTTKGRQLGRGIQHFRDDGSKLGPVAAPKDQYEDEAYEMWKLMEQRGKSGSLFGDVDQPDAAPGPVAAARGR